MVLIRADANEQLGTGHVMRCLSIARVFAKKGEQVLFVTADHRGDGLIQQNGFSSICLDSEWTNMDGETDALKMLIRKKYPTLLLVDSYYVTDKYLASLSECVKTVYMDDLNSAKWNVDALINYNIFSSIFDYAAYEGTRTKLLLSPKYAPLRDEFRACPKHQIKSVTDILVSAGGADPERITEKMIEGVCPEYPEINFHFIVGALNPRLDEIKKLAESKKNAFLHINEKHMSDLMKSCDMAISAAGITLYELCACGTPTITYSLADNQIAAANAFDLSGLMKNVGDCRNNNHFIEILGDSLDSLIANKKEREIMSIKMQSAVEGRGADLIADEIEKLITRRQFSI